MFSADSVPTMVALVTGASRGGGKGIALVLGEEHATVYVTGRSIRGEPTTLDRPGTIDDTAEQLSARGGGKGIALVLGEEHATVYVTGRSIRGEPTTLDRPGTIDDTAEQLSARG